MGQGVPSDLEPLKEPLIKAVINAYMAKKVPSMVDGMEWDHGGCDAGEFRFKHSRFGKDAKAYCYYPSGEWKIDIWVGKDHDASTGDRVSDYFDLFDAAATFEMVRTNVSEWIDPWIASSDPNQLNGAISGLAEVVNRLYVQAEVRVENAPGSGDSSDSGKATTQPVADIQAAIADMGSQLSSLNGLAVDALEQAYVNDVGLTISGQRALAAIATLAIAGEAEAWSQTYGNLAEFFGKAASDFNSLAGSSEGSGEGGATALSAISGVTGLAALGTAEFPPAALVLGAISGLAGLGATFWPSQEGVPAVTAVIEGGDFDSWWASFGDSVNKVNSQLVQSEYALATMCRNALADYDSNPNSYSITEVGRSSNTDPQPGDDLPRFLQADQDSPNKELFAGDNINIVHAKLRNVAGMIEHVGDHQREVAGRLGGGQLVADDWSRSYLHGSIIGWGPSGHHADYASVVDAVTDLLLLESRTAHRVAEKCLNVSTGFARTDEQIEAGLDALESRMYP